MADLSITASSVVPAAGATIIQGTAGAAITAGQPCYKDANDSDSWKPCDANGSDATAEAKGIAVCGAADGQPVSLITRGNLETGATTVKGQIYCVSATEGGIAPVSDLTTGDRTTILAVATNTTGTLAIHIHPSGVTR